MNTNATHVRSDWSGRTLRRRGSVYVMVLMVSLIVMVIGLGSVAISRSAIRATRATADWSEAGAGAQSGVEYALAVMNSSSTWRTDTSSGATIGAPSVGRARVYVSIVDEIDGNLSDDPTEPVRVYGAANVGATSRAYSVLAAPSSTAGMDVLRCALHAAGNVTVSGNALVSAGPLSSAGTISNSATLTSDIETNTLSSTGFVLGYVQTGVAAKNMPANTVWTTLAAIATPIPWPAGGNLDNDVLTAAVNTMGGSTNVSGVYSISVPVLSTLTIHHSRLQATLLVTLGASASLVVKEENLWDPADATKPSLLVQGSLLSSVTLQGGAASLSEGPGKNYNPVGAPYNGVVDADTTDTYPNELHGVFHVMDATPLTIAANLRVVGCVIVGGNVTINTAATLTANPSLLTTPPLGYSDTSSVRMAPVPGTYRWEVADVNVGG